MLLPPPFKNLEIPGTPKRWTDRSCTRSWKPCSRCSESCTRTNLLPKLLLVVLERPGLSATPSGGCRPARPQSGQGGAPPRARSTRCSPSRGPSWSAATAGWPSPAAGGFARTNTRSTSRFHCVFFGVALNFEEATKRKGFLRSPSASSPLD